MKHDVDIAAALDVGSHRGFFYTEPVKGGWIIEIRRRKHPVERIKATSAGALNRIRSELSDEGLIGINEVVFRHDAFELSGSMKSKMGQV